MFFSPVCPCVCLTWKLLKAYKHLVAVAVYYRLKFAVNDLCIELFKQMHFVWKECHSKSKRRSILFFKKENLFVGSPREQPLKADFNLPPPKKIEMADYLHPIMSELYP